MLWIIVIIASCGALVALGLFYPRIRASTNFGAGYVRALRLEGNKEQAISRALSHLATFLRPFTGLSGKDIDFIAAEFSDLSDPPSALQPLLQWAERERSIARLVDREHLLAWKAEWKAKKES